VLKFRVISDSLNDLVYLCCEYLSFWGYLLGVV